MTSYQVLFFWCLHSNYLWLPWNCFSLCKRRVNWQRELSKFSSRHIDFFRMMKAHVDSVVYEGWQKGNTEQQVNILPSIYISFVLRVHGGDCIYHWCTQCITFNQRGLRILHPGGLPAPWHGNKSWWCSTYFFFLSNKKCVERKEGICNSTLFVFYIFWLDFLDDCATCLILRVKVV